VNMAADRFSVHMEAVAKAILGEPNAHLSSATELRYGQHGSLSVDLQKGVWADHEANTGGGVLDFLAAKKGLKTGEALDWLREQVGAEIEDRREQRPKSRMIAAYDYVDEAGEVLFQVCRFEPKDFRQRRPDPSAESGWNWNTRGVRQVPYRLADLGRAINAGETVFVVEGEKDVEALAREGVTATCNAMGAGKWTDELSFQFAAADVVILPDNDQAGRAHAAMVAASLKGRAKRVRTLELPDLPPKGDVSDWLAQGGDGAQLLQLAKDASEWAPAPPESRFGALDFSEAICSHVAYPPLVKGLLYQGDKAMVFGDSGSGKSFLCVDMGLSISRGVPFLGMKTAKGAVLYQAGEGGRGLIKRLKAYAQDNHVSDELPFKLLPVKVNLFAADGDAEAFITECCAWKAWYEAQGVPLRLIVIDTFSAASVGANENASEDMGRMLDAGDRLNAATGAAVAWVHHKNAAGLRERGHGSFRANIETAIEVKRDLETNERSLHLIKLKDGEDGLKLGFELQSVQLGVDDDGDPITSCVVRPAQMKAAPTGHDLKPRLSAGQASFLQCLDDAIIHRGGVMPPGICRDPQAIGVEWRDFVSIYKAVRGSSLDDNALRQALKRDGDTLTVKGFIGRNSPWVWITSHGVETLLRIAR